MALSAQAIAKARAAFVNELYHPPGSAPCKFTKPELEAAASATDAWIDANQAAFNAALPLPFRTGATAGEKAALFMAVLIKRFRG